MLRKNVALLAAVTMTGALAACGSSGSSSSTSSTVASATAPTTASASLTANDSPTDSAMATETATETATASESATETATESATSTESTSEAAAPAGFVTTESQALALGTAMGCPASAMKYEKAKKTKAQGAAADGYGSLTCEEAKLKFMVLAFKDPKTIDATVRQMGIQALKTPKVTYGTKGNWAVVGFKPDGSALSDAVTTEVTTKAGGQVVTTK